MKEIRFSVTCSFLIYSSFLFAHGDHALQDTIPADKAVKQLPAVVLRRQASQGRLSGDTLIFDAQRFARPSAFRLEELLRDVPGFRVDGEGRIYFNGREISSIMIDGEDLAGQQYRLLSRNLRSMMVDKLELIQDHQPNRLLKGMVASAGTAINIRIKKEYQGRVTGSGSLQGGIKNLLDADAEGMVLKDNRKQMIFFNCNNTGEHGVGDRLQGNDATVSAQRFDVHPFPFDPSASMMTVQRKQMLRNDDGGMTVLSSFKTGKGEKISVAASLGSYLIQQEQDMSRSILVKDQHPFTVVQHIDFHRRTEQLEVRSILERDRGDDKVVKSVLAYGIDRSQHQHKEYRSGLANYHSILQTGEDRWRLQWDHESTRKLSKNRVMQWQYKLGSGELRTATGMIREGSDSVFSIARYQIFYRNGLLTENHFNMMGVSNKLKWKWGWRSVFESTYSNADAEKIGYALFKSYPYVSFNWFPVKRMEFQTHAATGFTWYGKRMQFHQPVYALEQRWLWKLKGLLQIHAETEIARRSPELKNIFAGPVLIYDGTIREGNDQVAFPSVMHIRLGGSQMNLNAGRNWGLMMHYQKILQDLGQVMDLNSSGEKWKQEVVNRREIFRTNFHLEQYLMFLKSRIRINGSFSDSRLPQWLNGMMSLMRLRSGLLELRIIHQGKGSIGWEGQYRQNVLLFGLPGMESNHQKMRQDAFTVKFWIKWNQHVHSELSFEKTISDAANPLTIIDNSWVIDICKRWRFMLTAQNILDQKRYTTVAADIYGLTTTDQVLNGRRIIGGIRYLF